MTGPLGDALLQQLAGGPRILADLCEAVGHTPPLVEGALRLLARDGLVEREADRTGVWTWKLSRERAA